MTEGWRCVCDTNLLISGILTLGTAAKVLDYFLLDAGRLIFSHATAAELIEVLMRPKFDPYVSRDKRRALLDEIILDADYVEPNQRFSLCRDPKDDKFLEAAVAARAHCLISGDQDLLVLRSIEQIPIVTPARFLDLRNRSR